MTVEMFFADRLVELCMRGDHENAILLAKEHLRLASDVSVLVDGASVLVETPHFRGVHRWSIHADGELQIDHGGRYRSTVDGLDLALSTATMNPRALELARAEIEALRASHDVATTSDGGPRTAC